MIFLNVLINVDVVIWVGGYREIGGKCENAGGRDGILKGKVSGAHEWSKQSVGDAESTGGSRGAQRHVVRELKDGISAIEEKGENAGGQDGILKGEVAGAHEWSKQSVSDGESTGGSRMHRQWCFFWFFYLFRRGWWLDGVARRLGGRHYPAGGGGRSSRSTRNFFCPNLDEADLNLGQDQDFRGLVRQNLALCPVGIRGHGPPLGADF